MSNFWWFFGNFYYNFYQNLSFPKFLTKFWTPKSKAQFQGIDFLCVKPPRKSEGKFQRRSVLSTSSYVARWFLSNHPRETWYQAHTWSNVIVFLSFDVFLAKYNRLHPLILWSEEDLRNLYHQRIIKNISNNFMEFTLLIRLL